MKTRWAILIGVAVLLASTTAGRAALMLGLEAQAGVDLEALKIGDTISVNVVLLGLGQGGAPTSLSTLLASVEVDPSVFNTPVITPGPIIPDAGDFTQAIFSDLADGAFFQIFGGAISQDGVFYTVDLTVKDLGGGQLALDPLGLLAGEFFGGDTDLEGGDPLDFEAIPTPATLPIIIVSGLVAAIGRGQRRR